MHVCEFFFGTKPKCEGRTVAETANAGDAGRALATCRKIDEGGAYIGGYSEPFDFVLGPRLGTEMF